MLFRSFTEAHGIFLQLYIAQVEAFIQFQQYVFTLEAKERRQSERSVESFS